MIPPALVTELRVDPAETLRRYTRTIARGLGEVIAGDEDNSTTRELDTLRQALFDELAGQRL